MLNERPFNNEADLVEPGDKAIAAERREGAQGAIGS